MYDFVPTVSDPDGDSLSFSIVNQPNWANFDPSDGRVYGVPQATDAGLFPGIAISVSDGLEQSSFAAFDIEVIEGLTNRPPEIGGDPPTEVMVGKSYSFTPTADDSDGDDLTFSIENKPGWASFNSPDGTLSGTPMEVDVGMTSSVAISVSDTQEQASLPPFDIEVQSEGSAVGSATLTWTPPTERVDGTPLTNIAGYGIAYGRTSGIYDQVLEINNPGISTYMVENLNQGTWFFAVYVYDDLGLTSDYSDEASKEIADSTGSPPGKGKK